MKYYKQFYEVKDISKDSLMADYNNLVDDYNKIYYENDTNKCLARYYKKETEQLEKEIAELKEWKEKAKKQLKVVNNFFDDTHLKDYIISKEYKGKETAKEVVNIVYGLNAFNKRLNFLEKQIEVGIEIAGLIYDVQDKQAEELNAHEEKIDNLEQTIIGNTDWLSDKCCELKGGIKTLQEGVSESLSKNNSIKGEIDKIKITLKTHMNNIDDLIKKYNTQDTIIKDIINNLK